MPTAQQFFEEAEAAGVRIIVTDHAIVTGTPAGRLTRTILAAVAEFEGDLIRERTQVAMDAIRSGARGTRSGRPVGRPPRVTPELAAKIGSLRSSGLPWKTVAQRAGLPAETCRHAEQLLARRVRADNNPASLKTAAPPAKEVQR